MKQIIEQFQMEYTLADALNINALRLGKPHTLSDGNRTKITEHADENSGMSVHHVAQELSHKHEMDHTMLKKKKSIYVFHELKPEDYNPCYNYWD